MKRNLVEELRARAGWEVKISAWILLLLSVLVRSVPQLSVSLSTPFCCRLVLITSGALLFCPSGPLWSSSPPTPPSPPSPGKLGVAHLRAFSSWRHSLAAARFLRMEGILLREGPSRRLWKKKWRIFCLEISPRRAWSCGRTVPWQNLVLGWHWESLWLIVQKTWLFFSVSRVSCWSLAAPLKVFSVFLDVGLGGIYIKIICRNFHFFLYMPNHLITCLVTSLTLHRISRPRQRPVPRLEAFWMLSSWSFVQKLLSNQNLIILGHPYYTTHLLFLSIA